MRAMNKRLPPDEGLPYEKIAANSDAWRASQQHASSTAQISLTSVAVCFGILAWAIVNAYLSQP